MGSRSPGSNRNGGEEEGKGIVRGPDRAESYFSRVRVKAHEIKAKVIYIAERLSVGDPVAVVAVAVVAVVAISMVALVVISLGRGDAWVGRDPSTRGRDLLPPVSIHSGHAPSTGLGQGAPGPPVVVEPAPGGGPEGASPASGALEPGTGTEGFADDPAVVSLKILGISLAGGRLEVRGQVYLSAPGDPERLLEHASDLEVRVSLPDGIAETPTTALIDAGTSTWRVFFHPRARLRAGGTMEVEAVLFGDSGRRELHRIRSQILVQEPGAGP